MRIAAAIARQHLVSTAAAQWRVPASELSTTDGVITHKSGKWATYGSLAKAAAVSTLTRVSVELKPQSEFTVLGTPLEVKVVVMPTTTGQPSGAGELAVAPSLAAVACAYARATGSLPTYFPINHGTLGFRPYPLEPSTPESPTDGLSNAY